MHYHAEVWVPWELESAASRFVESVLAPYRENEDGEGWWDWYQIGGRYTGRHVPDYDPNTDPDNIETCDICNGTGFRTDKLGNKERAKTPSYTCNACGDFDRPVKGKITGWKHGPAGAGKQVKWPTKWARFTGDIMEVKDLPESLTCYTLIVQGQVFQREIWTGDDFIGGGFDGLVVSVLKNLNVTRGHLVTVDYHS